MNTMKSNTMKSVKLNRTLREKYNELKSRLGWEREEISEIYQETLIYLVCYCCFSKHDIRKLPKETLFRIFSFYKRIEADDVPWLRAWKGIYNNAEERNKDAILVFGVYLLIHEDLRFDGCKFGNARPTFLEIQEDYARVLGVNVARISNCIEQLVFHRIVIEYKDDIWKYKYMANDFLGLSDMSVYLPKKMSISFFVMNDWELYFDFIKTEHERNKENIRPY